MPRVATAQSPSKDTSTANLGVEGQIWLAAEFLPLLHSHFSSLGNRLQLVPTF